MTRTPSNVDPDGLLEYSVVFTDRALNHMSHRFGAVMRDISSMLRQVYQAHAVALVPGGGTAGMEAVARQYASGGKVLVVRNGWFSYRWSQILERGGIAAATRVVKAQATGTGRQSPFAPPPIDTLVATIAAERPDVVFAPHVETASGILLPEDYLRRVANAAHAAGSLFVLDAIASGALWIDMQAIGVDILISAPQKSWSATPCAAMVMFSAAAEARLAETSGSSFTLDLATWRRVMKAYEDGSHAYHSTLPTDALVVLHKAMRDTLETGMRAARAAQQELGERVRALLAERGFPSVAAPGFEAPGVVVSYTDDDRIHNGSAFREHGVQVAAGVPLGCGEPDDFRTFRIGLFGLDKLRDVDGTVTRLTRALDAMTAPRG